MEVQYQVRLHAIGTVVLVPCYRSRSDAPPIAFGRAPARRPARACRQRSTRARCLTDAGVVCLVHIGVATSLTASASDTGARQLAGRGPALLPAHAPDTLREVAPASGAELD
jgi:hypothetical protein